MSDAIEISSTVHVPAWAISAKAVRASGPGGQNVNKVSTKIEMRIQVRAIQGLSPLAMERLLGLLRNRMDADGCWMVSSQKTRDQLKNLEDARQKVMELIQEAMEIPTTRISTRPTRGSRVRRVDDKKRLSEKKRGRSGSFD